MPPHECVAAPVTRVAADTYPGPAEVTGFWRRLGLGACLDHSAHFLGELTQSQTVCEEVHFAATQGR